MQKLFKSKTILTLLPIMMLVFFCQQSQAVQFRNKSKSKKKSSFTQANYPWGFQIALDRKKQAS